MNYFRFLFLSFQPKPFFAVNWKAACKQIQNILRKGNRRADCDEVGILWRYSVALQLVSACTFVWACMSGLAVSTLIPERVKWMLSGVLLVQLPNGGLETLRAQEAEKMQTGNAHRQWVCKVCWEETDPCVAITRTRVMTNKQWNTVCHQEKKGQTPKNLQQSI